MAGLLSTDIMNDAALLLNDFARITFTYTVQIPWLKKAIDAFSDELAVNSISFLEKRSVISPTISAGITTIPLPADALLPVHLEERAFGSSDAWIEMTEVNELNPNLTPETSFRVWAFQGTLLNSVPVIDVPNANSVREVRITYIRFLSTVGIDATTDFSTSLTFQSKRYISAKTAEYITRFVLQNEKRGNELKQESESARYRIIQIWTKKRQSQPIRKSRFSGPSLSNISSYPAISSGSGSPVTNTYGVIQSNLFKLMEGIPFATPGDTPFKLYYDSSSLKVRFQNHDSVTRRGWIFSGNAGVATEISALEIDPDGRLFQLGRATPIGEYQSPAHNAANFTSTIGTWTVVAGTTKVSYERSGNKVTFHIDISGSSVSNAASILQLNMFGLTAVSGKGDFYFPVRVSDAGGAATWGLAKISAGGSVIQFFSTVLGNGFAIAVANTTIQVGDITVEVIP